MDGRGVVSCNQCNAKFLSVPDVENHIASAHGQSESSTTKETRFGRETQARMDDDIEAIFAEDTGSDSEADDDQDEVDSGIGQVLEDLKSLREACLPLSEKIRPKQNQGERRTVGAEAQSQRIKRWPQIKQQAAQEFEVHTFGDSMTKMEAWGSRATEVKNSVNKFTFWTNRLRKVEGKFGSGVFNYFKFLKWSMFLNFCLALLTLFLIILPQYILVEEPVGLSCDYAAPNNSLWFPVNQTKVCCSEKWQEKQETYRQKNFNWPPTSAGNFFGMVGTGLLDFLMGDGWMEDTVLYYGHYREDNTGSYQTAIAYFFVIFSCFVFSLLQIVRSSAHSFSRSFKWNQFNSSQYFDLVFCSWDFSIVKEETINIKRLGLLNEVNTALSTDKVQAQYSQMTKTARVFLNIKRFVAWVIVLACYGGYGYLIFYVNNEVKPVVGDNITCSLTELFSSDDYVDNFKCAAYPYYLPLTITFMNLVIPFLFSYIIVYEDYDPKKKLIIDIGRSIFLRLMSLLVAIIVIIVDFNCPFPIDKSLTEGELQTCTLEDRTEGCKRPMCWETVVGEKFYTLTITDLIIQMGMVLLVDIPRVKLLKCSPALSNIEFNIPKHTLDIIYSQTICWMGVFFSPLISLITFVKLFVIFYLRLGYLSFLCKPSSSLYEASKISSIMKIFLLISFASSLFPLTYIISQMEPSEICGPFRGVGTTTVEVTTFYSGVVEDLIAGWEALPGKNFLYFIGTLQAIDQYPTDNELIFISKCHSCQSYDHTHLCPSIQWYAISPMHCNARQCCLQRQSFCWQPTSSTPSTWPGHNLI